MATKLKNMKLTSVDLCKRGANPEAQIKITKSDGEGGEKKMGLWESIKKSLGMSIDNEELLGKIQKEIIDATAEEEIDTITKAMEESVKSICADQSMNEEDRNGMIEKSIGEFGEELRKARRRWVGEYPDEVDNDAEDEAVDEANESVPAKDDEDENLEKGCKTKKQEDKRDMGNINVANMSPEDRAAYDKLMAKYASKEEKKKEEEKPVVKTAEITPEVKKALDDLNEARERFELKEMTADFKKYEIIGKSADKLAEELYAVKKADAKAYDSIIKAYDEAVAVARNSDVFKTYGSSRSGGGETQAKVESAAAEIRKKDSSISYSESIVKACDENPELKAEYEAL